MKADNEVRTIWAENLLTWTEDRSEEVLKWLQSPAEAGVPQAMKLMGDLCATGIGIEKNLVRAFEWYKKAVALGNVDAQYTYAGFCYKAGDFAHAVDYYTKAAEQGHAKAQYSLGKCYQDGEGVDRNCLTAVKWYFKAAEQGDIDAQYALASCYKVGIGVEKNLELAAEWYTKAADGGHKLAQHVMAKCYSEGSDDARRFAKDVAYSYEAQ